MSKALDNVASSMPTAKSWADIDNDDFFAQVAQDKPSVTKTSPTAATCFSRSNDRAEKRSATTGGVPWSFPNPVQPQSGSPTSAMGGRFDSLSPNTRRSAPLGNWRK